MVSMELFAKKSLGQHFLNSTHVLDQIIEAAHIEKGEIVLEIGPGTGILTKRLLESGANVVAIEKDARAEEVLREKFEQELKSGQLTLIQGDVLNDASLDSFLHTSQTKKYALVANIPYYITGAILEKFLEHEPRPDRMVLLVQKEVAERIVARDGKESILSISVKAFGTPKLVAKVTRGAFTPPPTVDSAILSIENINNTLFQQKNVVISRFFEIVRAGFAHKRKYVIRNLEAITSKESLEKAWEYTQFDPKKRAEDIMPAQWIEIASQLGK